MGMGQKVGTHRRDDFLPVCFNLDFQGSLFSGVQVFIHSMTDLHLSRLMLSMSDLVQKCFAF